MSRSAQKFTFQTSTLQGWGWNVKTSLKGISWNAHIYSKSFMEPTPLGSGLGSISKNVFTSNYIQCQDLHKKLCFCLYLTGVGVKHQNSFLLGIAWMSKSAQKVKFQTPTWKGMDVRVKYNFFLLGTVWYIQIPYKSHVWNPSLCDGMVWWWG